MTKKNNKSLPAYYKIIDREFLFSVQRKVGVGS